jgi:hypothetical protein
MMIVAMEGQSWRYEVLVQSDGFLVQVRDMDTGELAIDDSTLFRTAPAALAYADMVAAADRFAAANLIGTADSELELELSRERDRFAALRLSLCDDGVCGDTLLRRQEEADAILRRKMH